MTSHGDVCLSLIETSLSYTGIHPTLVTNNKCESKTCFYKGFLGAYIIPLAWQEGVISPKE